jgi:hypothetical protein
VDGILVGPDEGEKVPRGDLYHRILAELPELEVIELRFGPDFAGVEPHSHSDHVDSFYVLEGIQVASLRMDALAHAPRWVNHLPPAPSWKTTVFSPVSSTTSK